MPPIRIEILDDETPDPIVLPDTFIVVDLDPLIERLDEERERLDDERERERDDDDDDGDGARRDGRGPDGLGPPGQRGRDR